MIKNSHPVNLLTRRVPYVQIVKQAVSGLKTEIFLNFYYLYIFLRTQVEILLFSMTKYNGDNCFTKTVAFEIQFHKLTKNNPKYTDYILDCFEPKLLLYYRRSSRRLVNRNQVNFKFEFGVQRNFC